MRTKPSPAQPLKWIVTGKKKRNNCSAQTSTKLIPLYSNKKTFHNGLLKPQLPTRTISKLKLNFFFFFFCVPYHFVVACELVFIVPHCGRVPQSAHSDSIRWGERLR
jgi:hypothetical protein